MSNLTLNDIVSDVLLESVFEGTNFGTRDYREIILTNLSNVNEGYHIGYTAKCCLEELGLLIIPRPRKFEITSLGKRYLDVARKEVSNERN